MPHQMTELMPPRPTFIQDMTPEEMEVMQAHAGYWARLAERGISVTSGRGFRVERFWMPQLAVGGGAGGIPIDPTLSGWSWSATYLSDPE